jgi:cyanophycinase
MVSCFLLGGGGDNPDGHASTYGRFLHAAGAPEGRKIALVVAQADESDAQKSFVEYRAIFESLGAAIEEFHPVFVSDSIYLTHEMLEPQRPSGVFVCGGLTPLYQQAVCGGRAWLDYLNAAQIPYGGVSAGAAIAAERTIVGGWRALHGGQERAILFRGASEGLDLLEIRGGLGLVPFAVDVHASQWGTLTRLIHAVAMGLVPEGYAIDEDTLLLVGAQDLEVDGLGQVYRVRPGGSGAVEVAIFRAGDRIHRQE